MSAPLVSKAGPECQEAVEWAATDPHIVTRVRRRLLRWGRANFKHYPWRTETSPWLTLVAEMMLQRTRASQVQSVFRDFQAMYPTAESFVRAGENAAREVTRRLGIHRRGPLLYRLACDVYRRGGIPPQKIEELRRVTGIGPYTAAAWISLHGRKRAVIADSNVARLLSRLTGCPYPRDPRHVHWLLRLADQLTPRRVYQAYNYAILDFTMGICTPRSPRHSECPLLSDCTYGQGKSRRNPS